MALGNAVLGPGTGDNTAAALGVGARAGDVVVSIGTSGVVAAVTDVPAADPSGIVCGFADATGRFLPLVSLHAERRGSSMPPPVSSVWTMRPSLGSPCPRRRGRPG